MLIQKNTKIADVIKTPAGYDVVSRILYALGLDTNILNGPLGKIRINDFRKLTLGKLDEDFIDSLLILLNSLNEDTTNEECEIKKEWWKEAVFYEIYPRSFKDSNDDGIGDIRGIISKLDYLKDLGVDALWICPFYDSPNCDNGYDIRDYKKIMSEFGDMSDVEELLNKAHEREIKVIVDLVMNHTSDEHEFFKRALAGEKEYEDYYILKDKPNNWLSFFSGSAWEYLENKNKYYLHLYAKKQVDLNWDNPRVREEMFDIANFWLDKGADGFRLDVVSFISKNPDFPDGNEIIGNLVGFRGVEHYFHGPKLDEYLREFNEKCLKPHNAYTVGECPGSGLKMSRLITGDDRNELSQLFSFDHIDNPGKMRFDIYNFDMRKMVDELIKWQEGYTNHCWPTLFVDNHDNPRMISKIDYSGQYREELSKLIAVLMFTLRGTPYVYQGQEIGMVNHHFKTLSEFKDVESLRKYDELIEKGVDEKTAFARLNFGSRDNARIPMAWSDEEFGGFSSKKPWIDINEDYQDINVKKEMDDDNSIFNFYKELIKYRKQHKTLIYGSFKRLKSSKDLFVYKRSDEEGEFVIVLNLTKKIKRMPVIKGELVFNNYNDTSVLRPYMACIYKIR